MGRQGKIMLDVPSGTLAAMAVLGMAFLLGGRRGLPAGRHGEWCGGSALSDYLQTYLTLAQDGTEGAPGFWAVLWGADAFSLAALLMGFTALGVIGLPVLFAVRGFLFSFSVACFCRLFGGAGLIPALFLFGLPALLWAPALFVLGGPGDAGAYGLLRRVTGTAAIPSAMTPPMGSARAVRRGSHAVCDLGVEHRSGAGGGFGPLCAVTCGRARNLESGSFVCVESVGGL